MRNGNDVFGAAGWGSGFFLRNNWGSIPRLDFFGGTFSVKRPIYEGLAFWKHFFEMTFCVKSRMILEGFRTFFSAFHRNS